MSAYHITRFVLDQALVHAMDSAEAQEKVFWQGWLKGVLRMFSHRLLPPGLRAGLLRKANGTPLVELVQGLPESTSQAQKESTRAEKERAWIKRMDDGNARMILEYQQRYLVLQEERKKRDEEYQQRYFDSMLPVWSARLNKYMEQRDLELKEFET